MKLRHRFLISVTVGMIVFFYTKPPQPNYLMPIFASTPVRVSPYHRSDGTAIQGYSRAEPGGRRATDDFNGAISEANLVKYTAYSRARGEALLLGLGAFLLSFYWLWDDMKKKSIDSP